MSHPETLNQQRLGVSLKVNMLNTKARNINNHHSYTCA